MKILIEIMHTLAIKSSSNRNTSSGMLVILTVSAAVTGRVTVVVSVQVVVRGESDWQRL